MIEFAQDAVAIYGVLAVIMSGWLSWRFFRAQHFLGYALGWQLAGECFITAVTMSFSLMTLFGRITPAVEVTLRVAIFTAAVSTSLFLYRNVRKIEKSVGGHK